jgi:hypothetical protein
VDATICAGFLSSLVDICMQLEVQLSSGEWSVWIPLIGLIPPHFVYMSQEKDKKKKVYSINIISQYNAQCSAIRDAMREIGYININVNTVVASQGMVNIKP